MCIAIGILTFIGVLIFVLLRKRVIHAPFISAGLMGLTTFFLTYLRFVLDKIDTSIYIKLIFSLTLAIIVAVLTLLRVRSIR